MKLTDIQNNSELRIHIELDSTVLKFTSKHVFNDDDGIVVTPYIRDGKAIPMNIEMKDACVCSVYYNDEEGHRQCWRNVTLHTVVEGGMVAYCIKTLKFNSISKPDERRKQNRIVLNKDGHLCREGVSNQVVTIHDISDTGLSFCTPLPIPSLEEEHFYINFTDICEKQQFEFDLKCEVIRHELYDGKIFYGCQIINPDHDFLLYIFLRKKKV